ncbi:MAG: SWIM zinc finger family protein [Flavobacteriales bacterium]|nr:SWIM zinc finger family protein [Flavobacteriales bacterium]
MLRQMNNFCGCGTFEKRDYPCLRNN